MPVEALPIITHYDVQRFKQFSPQDCANWYISLDKEGKRPEALYPCMGRRHITTGGLNRLIFANEPRGLFKSVDHGYIIEGSNIDIIGQNFSNTKISNSTFTSNSGMVQFDYLPTPSTTFSAFVDGQGMWVYDEAAGTFQQVTDPRMPANPTYIIAFGNRFAVAGRDTTEFRLTQVNLGGVFDPATCFTVNGGTVFAQEAGIIRGFTVLHNTLYIFTDFTTGLWSNIPSTFNSTTFPWKKNSSNDWDFGLADPLSVDTDFGMIVFLAKNRNGLVQVMASNGQAPVRISTKAIDVLFERDPVNDTLSPFLLGGAQGFLYVYENTIFYRLSAGRYTDNQILEISYSANSIEFNFDAEKWERCIELNGERNRIEKHVYFNNRHLVSVQQDGTVYEMSGRFYTNEIRNKLQTNPQAADAYRADPMRYELVTPIISNPDYSEDYYNYVEIDFVWGESNNIFSLAPFQDVQFIIDEAPDSLGEPVYIQTDDSPTNDPQLLIMEESNVVTENDITYNTLFKPHIELYWSDNGGQMYYPADVRQFSDLGYYRWRMRWYELATSRNRCFKLSCVSNSPIVILGAVFSRKRASGGAN